METTNLNSKWTFELKEEVILPNINVSSKSKAFPVK